VKYIIGLRDMEILMQVYLLKIYAVKEKYY